MGMDVEYDLQALKDGLGKLDNDIRIFEEAIQKAEDTKRDYRRMIRVLEEKQRIPKDIEIDVNPDLKENQKEELED